MSGDAPVRIKIPVMLGIENKHQIGWLEIEEQFSAPIASTLASLCPCYREEGHNRTLLWIALVAKPAQGGEAVH